MYIYICTYALVLHTYWHKRTLTQNAFSVGAGQSMLQYKCMSYFLRTHTQPAQFVAIPVYFSFFKECVSLVSMAECIATLEYVLFLKDTYTQPAPCVAIPVYVLFLRSVCLLCQTVLQYGVATISRLLKIIGLFCRISSLLQGSFAKERYNFKEPTNRIHPIPEYVLFVLVCPMF